MYSTLIPNETPRAEMPVEDAIPEAAFILGLVYMEAGLSPEAALRSAMADYMCSFPEAEMALI